MTRTCHRCHGYSDDYEEAKLKRCAGCQKVYYCSTYCQKYDWVEHIFDCKPRRPINTADYLALAVRQNLLPEHPQTCIDYGFSRAFSADEKSNLLGLYIGMSMHDFVCSAFLSVCTGLIKYREIPPKTIHDWRVRGVLVDEIKATFHKIPGLRNSYFAWFLQNEHIVANAGQPLSDEALHDNADAMVIRAWRFTGGSEKDTVDQIKAAIARKPIEEQQCHHLYTLLLAGWHPSPDLDLWVDFGFAACTSQEAEMELATSYRELVMMCTFKEFCDAFRGRRLIDFLHSKEIYDTATRGPRLNDLLHFKEPQADDNEQLRDLLHAKWKKSVWYLKQTIVQEESTKEEASIRRSVMVDYGFINCKNDSERRELKRVYRAFFEKHDGDALALHEAAIKGNIHGYLSNVVQGLRDPKFRRLMKNPYPLPDL